LAKSGKAASKNQVIGKAKQIIRQEALAIFIGLSMIAGAATFCMIARQAGHINGVNWIWLAITSALIGLPKVFSKLKNKEEPRTITFARGFREGFLSLPLVAPDISRWITKARRLWKSFDRG